MNTEPVAQARAHLASLFASADRGYAVLFLLPGETSRCYDATDPAQLDRMAAEAVELSAAHDVYVGVNLVGHPVKATERGAARDVAAVTAFVADFDIKSNTAGKPGAIAELAPFVKGLPLRASLLVGSGGGVHAYWILKEPYAFDSPQERADVAALSRAWGVLIKRRAAERGWAFDAVHDLARVLRLAGTVNRKPIYPSPLPVGMLKATDRRFALSDFEDLIPADIGIGETPAATDEGKLVLTAAQIERIATVLADVPRSDVRHRLALYLAAWLANNLIAEESTLAVVRLVSEAGGDQDTAKKLRAVSDTYARLRSGQRPYGWAGLKELLTPVQLGRLDRVLNPLARIPVAPFPTGQRTVRVG